MTADMAFECLLISKDSSLIASLTPLLEDLSISTNVYANPARAVDDMSEASADLLILDWEEEAADFLRQFTESRRWRKPTVMIVSDSEGKVATPYSLLRKPITHETGALSLSHAYSNMLRVHREHARYALTNSLIAMDQNGRTIPISVENIGKGGIGLSTKELLVRGDVLSFSLLLPDTDTPIHIEAGVQWVRQYGAAGCEFVYIAQPDLDVLHRWLNQKCQVKKPLAEL